MDILGIEMTGDEADALWDWLHDEKGAKFWAWLAQESEQSHKCASMPPNQIMDLFASQRNLAEEAALERAFNFKASAIEEIALLKKA